MRVFFDMVWLALRYNIPPRRICALLLSMSRHGARTCMSMSIGTIFPACGTECTASGTIATCKTRTALPRFARQMDFRMCTLWPCSRAAGKSIPRRPLCPMSRKSGPRPCVSMAAPAAPNGSGTARTIATGRPSVPAASLGDVFRKQDCLVQPYVENHPDIAQVTNGALASLRIVTGLNERAEAEFVASYIGLPRGAHETTVAGIVCSIDARDGAHPARCISGRRAGDTPSRDECTHYRSRGAILAGERGPCAPRALHRLSALCVFGMGCRPD